MKARKVCKHEIVVLAHVSKSSFTDMMPVAHLSSPVVIKGNEIIFKPMCNSL